jgi:hypothetical protein
MRLPPLSQNIEHWRRALVQHRRVALIVGGGLFVLLVVLIWATSGTKPPPHAFPQPPAKPVEAPLPPDQAALILQLFNPSDQSLTHQLSTTVFTQQIEQAMTVSFVLTKCQIITQDEYSDTFRALIMYAQQTKLAADEPSAEKLVRQLADSATASYTLIYSNTPCTDKTLPVLAKQLHDWVDAVFKR